MENSEFVISVIDNEDRLIVDEVIATGYILEYPVFTIRLKPYYKSEKNVIIVIINDGYRIDISETVGEQDQNELR